VLDLVAGKMGLVYLLSTCVCCGDGVSGANSTRLPTSAIASVLHTASCLVLALAHRAACVKHPCR
jgi:hypothetical protein